jgi:hypothetical protein
MLRFRAFLIIVILFFGIGADDPRLISYPNQKIMGFRGLDTRSTAPTISDSRATALNNVKLSSALDLRRRYGLDTINDRPLDDLDMSNPPIEGIFDSVFSNGNSWTLAFVGSKLKYDNSGIWQAVPIAFGGSGTITSDKNSQWQCVMALDNAICTNDTNVPIRVNSTPERNVIQTTGLTVTLDKAKVVAWFRNFLVWGNTTESGTDRPTRFRWTNVGTINTYTDDDFNDISTFGGDEIIGFAELYGDIYIFLTKSIWRASFVGGDDVFVFTKVVDGIGAISRDSIKLIQLSDNRSAVIFLDDRRKVLLSDASTITDIGNIIQPTLDTLNAARLQYTVATFDGQSYFLSASTSSGVENDTLFEYQTEIGEWTKHTQIDANAMAQVKEATARIKTYVGNYDSFVYWLDNPDLLNDIDGATGTVDSVQTMDTPTITGAQLIVDTTLPTGVYTGAIIRITSGTAVGEEQIILTAVSTGLVVASPFTTTPTSSSIYSIGDIPSTYTTKWYDFGDSNREKSFLGILFWAEEASSNSVTVSHAIDFGTALDTTEVSLAPDSSSLWDFAIWDESVWGSTGDKFGTVKITGFGNFLQLEFENNDIDESFHIYGFNLLGIASDIKQ